MKEGPTTVAPVFPAPSPEPLLIVVVVGLLLLPVLVPEAEDTEDETKGLESLESTAAVRSNSNWRVLSSWCCVMVADTEAEFRAEPTFQAQIQGEVVEDLEESSLHVVPICG